MATLLKVWNNLADIKSAGGVALGLGTQGLSSDSSWRRISTEIVGMIALTAVILFSVTQIIGNNKRDFSADFSNDFFQGNIVKPIVVAQPQERQGEYERIFKTLVLLPADVLYRFRGQLATLGGQDAFCKTNGKIDCGELTSWEIKPLVDQVAEFRGRQSTQESTSQAIFISLVSLAISIFTFLMAALKMYWDYQAAKRPTPIGI
jgi:hypothetical protein